MNLQTTLDGSSLQCFCRQCKSSLLQVLSMPDLPLSPADADSIRAALPNLTDFNYEQASGVVQTCEQPCHSSCCRRCYHRKLQSDTAFT